MVGSAKKSSPKTKQGTLFSFFSKKKPSPSSKTNSNKVKNKSSDSNSNSNSDSVNAKATSKKSSIIANTAEKVPSLKSSSSSLSSSNAKRSKRDDLLASIKVGLSISVFWPADQEYYRAKVTAKKRQPGGSRPGSNTFTLLYDDGEVETIDLTNEKFKILKDSKAADAGLGTDVVETSLAVPVSQESASKSSKKRRFIQEESEEELLFDDEVEEDEDSEEEFEVDEDDEEDSDDDLEAMDLDNDEDDDEISNKKMLSSSARKRVRVTAVNTNTSSAQKKQRSNSSFITPPPKPRKSSTSASASTSNSKSNAFTAFASNSSIEDAAATIDRKVTPLSLTPKSVTKTLASSSSSPKKASNIPFPQAGVVNQAGTHYHNHFKFLQNPRDKDGRTISDPSYDSRTLKVDYNEMARVTQSKLTPASQQWWEIKSQYADTLLLFKVGKFYEIFHMDCDSAVQALNLAYMKGQVAHAGFPEGAYGIFTERLVKAGFKVARVEQTETPDMLKERKKKTKGKKPQVVNREVCSIVSAGTRTFCYLDDVSALEKDDGQGGIGPLLVIKEVLLERSPSIDDNSVQPVCEYGVTIIDAATGAITLGQFADDVLRSRMNTLLTKYRPSEILTESGSEPCSQTLDSLIQSMKNTILPACTVGKIKCSESFPNSSALDAKIRAKMQRTSKIKPWDKEETLKEMHRRVYFPRESRKSPAESNTLGISRWPDVLKACINGGADLALSSFGAALFYLQRSLIDEEILSMGIIKAYIPPDPANAGDNASDEQTSLTQIVCEEQRFENGIDETENIAFASQILDESAESAVNHMSLDGITIANLEILANTHSNTTAGSLWSKVNHTKSPFGCRLLRAWLLRPLFRKADIDRRADAVEELTCGAAAAAMSEARDILGKCGDLERLLSRVHSMSGNTSANDGSQHPNERAVLYELSRNTKRKVGDFSKILNGLRAASKLPEVFDGIDINSGLLNRIVRTTDSGGLFPSKLSEHLDWFFDTFDCDKAAKGLFEPTRGMDERFDEACDAIDRIKQELEDYKNDMISNVLRPSHLAKQWNYANTKVDSKDKYLIELPVSVSVPGDFLVKGKRGKGAKQINKYRTSVVESLVQELEQAYDVMKAGKARGMQLIFAKFDSMRSLWASAAQASAMIDALGSLAMASSRAGWSRPKVEQCSSNDCPSINIVQGKHPNIEFTHSGGDVIPNDLQMGGSKSGSKILLLSGPNMGGKSTLLRQTCLIAILAQIGCFVPAEECNLTPFDRIFTRLGASDRILLGQSTFFVELAETAAALRGATRRSLVIMDELGRGTSTFDGTAIASATVSHLVDNNQCLTLFATHYHSLLEDFKGRPGIRLGHMECFVQENENSDGNSSTDKDSDITFLYTLGEGSCPKSFGINVARLAGLPEEVLEKAKLVSSSFEKSMSTHVTTQDGLDNDTLLKKRVETAIQEENWQLVEEIWESIQD